MSIFANSEDPDEMQHNVCKGIENLQTKITVFF